MASRPPCSTFSRGCCGRRDVGLASTDSSSPAKAGDPVNTVLSDKTKGRCLLGAPISRGTTKHNNILSHLPFDHQLLDLGNGFRGIEILGTGFSTIENRVAAVEPERVFQIIEPL